MFLVINRVFKTKVQSVNLCSFKFMNNRFLDSGRLKPTINRDREVRGNSLAVPVHRERRKVALKPGHSPLDWAHLNSTTPSYILRGLPPSAPPPYYVKVTMEELKQHSKKGDCWTSINGKVFNITPYVEFHPGGESEILKCAGKDGTFLFNKYHHWVNADKMLEKCCVGVLSKN